MCIHCSLRKKKCRLKSTTTNGWRHFGQLEQRKSLVLFPIQSEKSPDSGFFTCDPTKKCIMPSSRERHKGIIGKGHDLRLTVFCHEKPKKQNSHYTATIYNLHLTCERSVRTKFNVSLDHSCVLPSLFVSCVLHHFIYPRFSPLHKFQYLLTFGASDMFVVLVTSSFFPRFYFFAHRY